MTMKLWMLFYHKRTRKELARITAHDIYPGEIKETVKLLAYNEGIKESDIAFKPIYQ